MKRSVPTRFDLTATAGDRERIAAFLDLAELNQLRFRGQIVPEGDDEAPEACDTCHSIGGDAEEDRAKTRAVHARRAVQADRLRNGSPRREGAWRN